MELVLAVEGLLSVGVDHVSGKLKPVYVLVPALLETVGCFVVPVLSDAFPQLSSAYRKPQTALFGNVLALAANFGPDSSSAVALVLYYSEEVLYLGGQVVVLFEHSEEESV